MHVKCSLCFLLLHIQIWLGSAEVCLKVPQAQRIPLALGVFLPHQYKMALESAVNTALDHIQNQSCILSDYYLDLHFKDTEVLRYSLPDSVTMRHSSIN